MTQACKAGNYVDAPLVVEVTTSDDHAPLTGAPVTFAVTSGKGQITLRSGSAVGTRISTVTGNDGEAAVYFQSPARKGTTNIVTVTCGEQRVRFQERTSPGDGTFDGPSDGMVTRVSETEIDITWVNHASAATYIIIQDSIDNGGTWRTFVKLGPTATSYAAKGLDPGRRYLFRIAAGN